jgi:hypothetical protein
MHKPSTPSSSQSNGSSYETREAGTYRNRQLHEAHDPLQRQRHESQDDDGFGRFLCQALAGDQGSESNALNSLSKAPLRMQQLSEHNRAAQGTAATAVSQMDLDGLDVVALLSTQSNDEDTLSIQEQSLPDVSREILFRNERTAQPLGTLLDFEPNFFEDPTLTFDLLGTTDPSAARQAWLEMWQDLLHVYNDEIWGTLSPLVSAARSEVQDMREVGMVITSQLRALERLRQVLAHVRGLTP